jgi:hypothetical protein
MGHPNKYQQNVTPIEDLFDVDESQNGGVASKNSAIVQSRQMNHDDTKIATKHIRPHHSQHPDSGMVGGDYVEQGPPPSIDMDVVPYNGPHIKQSLADRVENGHSPSCLRVADHISECRMCSTFYNPDKTLYIIVIVVLSIICILLLKRVLDI